MIKKKKKSLKAIPSITLNFVISSEIFKLQPSVRFLTICLVFHHHFSRFFLFSYWPTKYTWKLGNIGFCGLVLTPYLIIIIIITNSLQQWDIIFAICNVIHHHSCCSNSSSLVYCAPFFLSTDLQITTWDLTTLNFYSVIIPPLLFSLVAYSLPILCACLRFGKCWFAYIHNVVRDSRWWQCFLFYTLHPVVRREKY